MRVAIYARCSTLEQDPQIQVAELRRYCEARGWIIAETIVDHGASGANDQRVGLKRLLGLTRGRQVDAIVVVKLDRLARSLRHLVSILDEFQSLGVTFISTKDQIDMGTAAGRLMMHLISAMAEFELSLIRERTKCGLEFARSQGRVGGRPKVANIAEILRLRRKGLSCRKIAAKLAISKSTVASILATVQKTPA